MASVKIDGSQMVLVANTGTTASPTWKIVQCQLNGGLESSYESQDASSKCGTDVSLGDMTASFNVDGQLVMTDATATNRMTYEEWDALYQAKNEVEFKFIPKTSVTSTATGDEGKPVFSFTGKITSTKYDGNYKELMKFASTISLVGGYTLAELA